MLKMSLEEAEEVPDKILMMKKDKKKQEKKLIENSLLGQRLANSLSEISSSLKLLKEIKAFMEPLSRETASFNLPRVALSTLHKFLFSFLT